MLSSNNNYELYLFYEIEKICRTDNDIALIYRLFELNISPYSIFIPDNLSILHLAAMYGNLSIANYIMGGAVGVNAITIDGFTPLHYAAEFGHYEVVKFLLNNGADCKRVITNQNHRYYNLTPFEIAYDVFINTDTIMSDSQKQEYWNIIKLLNPCFQAEIKGKKIEPLLLSNYGIPSFFGAYVQPEVEPGNIEPTRIDQDGFKIPFRVRK